MPGLALTIALAASAGAQIVPGLEIPPSGNNQMDPSLRKTITTQGTEAGRDGCSEIR